MKFAAIDIGSNAIRFQISKVLNYQGVTSLKKIEYVRFPLRLGQDVFKEGRISALKEAKFIKLMHTFKMLIELYEVDDYIICATSAMRESQNGRELADKIYDLFEIEIQIIDGDREAEIINKVILNQLDDNKSYIHIDVGGGSTELNIFYKKEKIAAHSFRIGSVRRLGGDDSPIEWERMKEWVNNNVTADLGPLTAVGTGGNINKIYDLSQHTKPKGQKPIITLEQVERVQKILENHTLEERLNVLMLNNDRADVIVPASEIYLSVMKFSCAENILVPEIGLKDGLLLLLFEKNIAQILGQSENRLNDLNIIN